MSSHSHALAHSPHCCIGAHPARAQSGRCSTRARRLTSAARVARSANVSAVLAALLAIPKPALVRMRAAMDRAARLLDAGPRGRMAELVLAQFIRVADREVESAPRATRTPLPVQRCVGPLRPTAQECSAPPQIIVPPTTRTRT